jgi:type I restriction-modification system DNA methylase subunit
MDRPWKAVWAAADQLRANSGLTSAQYSQPVLGLIFLRFAEVRFLARRAVLDQHAGGGRRGSRVDDPTAYQAEGILYLSPEARFDHLLRLPEGADVGKVVNDAMRDVEAKNPQLSGVLPKTYQVFDGTLLKDLLKKVSEIPANTEVDTFGRIYEYFLGESLVQRAKAAASSTRRAASSACWSRSWSHTTAAFSTRRAARAACSCRAQGLWQSTRRVPRPNWPFMDRKRSVTRSSCAA